MFLKTDNVGLYFFGCGTDLLHLTSVILYLYSIYILNIHSCDVVIFLLQSVTPWIVSDRVGLCEYDCCLSGLLLLLGVALILIYWSAILNKRAHASLAF
jgi:hypothetical protein